MKNMKKNLLYVGLAAGLVGCLGVNNGNPMHKKPASVANVGSASVSSIDSALKDSVAKVDDSVVGLVICSLEPLVEKTVLLESQVASVSSLVYTRAAPNVEAGKLLTSSSIAYVSSGAKNLGTALYQNKTKKEDRLPALVLRYHNSAEDETAALSSRRAVALLDVLAEEFSGEVNCVAYPERGDAVERPFWTLRESGLASTPAFYFFENLSGKKSLPELYVVDLSDDKRTSDLYRTLHKKLADN